jgi:hypothetical protein
MTVATLHREFQQTICFFNYNFTTREGEENEKIFNVFMRGNLGSGAGGNG